MKLFKSIALLSAGLVIAGGLSSCSSEEPIVGNGTNTDAVSILKAPKVLAYSGDHIWGNKSRSNYKGVMSRADNKPDDVVKVQEFREKSDWLKGAHPGFYEAFDNAPETTDRGESVSQKEYEYVMAYLQAHPDQGATQYDLSTYFIQNVGSAGHQYTTTPDGNGTTHTTAMQSDFIEINGWHVNDYNSLNGPRIYIENLPLNSAAYHDSFGNNTFEYYRFYTIPMEDGTYNLYLCFDYATISQQGNVIPDGCYDDWVIKITPGDGSAIKPIGGGNEGGNEGGDQPGKETCPECGHTPHPGADCPECTNPEDGCYKEPEQPEQPEQPGKETCPDCGHTPHPGADCPECTNPEDGCYKEPEQPEQPGNPGNPDKPAVGHEVEVNLSASDKGDYLESHLSIHVRYATDVDIFIPVDGRFTCDADDMAIVQKHLEDLTVHGGMLEDGYSEISYDINGNTVYLKIMISVDGIHIWTEGINQAVIDYCDTTYGDGITFEIWNYYNDEIDKETLKSYLNQSIITFLDSCPDAYINAFAQNSDGSVFEDDCTVNIVDSQRDYFNDAVEGSHNNASEHNLIYTNKSASSEPAPEIPPVPVY